MRYTIKIISVAALLGVFAAQSAAASDYPSKQESVGVGTGGVIGAVAGGPVGFIIGAAIGAKIGDTMHKKNERIDTLSASLARSDTTIAHLERDLDTLGDRIEHLQEVSRPQLVAMLQAGIAVDLFFRTDEAALPNTTGGRFATLASTIATMPEIKVQLDGFADERGDADYNMQLSQKRVEFVREQLLQAGIADSNIKVSAHGEVAAEDTSVDSFALERRVSVTLFIDESPSFAANPN